jgi:hypothetical protein
VSSHFYTIEVNGLEKSRFAKRKDASEYAENLVRQGFCEKAFLYIIDHDEVKDPRIGYGKHLYRIVSKEEVRFIYKSYNNYEVKIGV